MGSDQRVPKPQVACSIPAPGAPYKQEFCSAFYDVGLKWGTKDEHSVRGLRRILLM